MSSIRTSFLLLVFVFVYTSVSAQFGVRAKYNNNNMSLENSPLIVQEDLFPNTLELGVDYWFRLKNHRIEFMPEVSMGLKSSTIYKSNITTFQETITNTYFGFSFNTQIYAFDLTGDCDCPTFSKQGPSLTKGFFFTVSPGLIMGKFDSTADYTFDYIAPRIGVGIGYDIGFSDLFTITPSVNYNFIPFSAILSDIGEIDSWNQLQFQLRFGFRPDYVRKNGRRR